MTAHELERTTRGSSNGIRPACEKCNTETGAALANSIALRVAKMRASAMKRTCPYCGARPKQRCRVRYGKDISTIHAARRPA